MLQHQFHQKTQSIQNGDLTIGSTLLHSGSILLFPAIFISVNSNKLLQLPFSVSINLWFCLSATIYSNGKEKIRQNSSLKNYTFLMITWLKNTLENQACNLRWQFLKRTWLNYLIWFITIRTLLSSQLNTVPIPTIIRGSYIPSLNMN